MLGWDRRLEGWIVAHRLGVFDPVAQGLSHVGTWAAVWLAIALVVAVVRRRLDVFLWTFAAGAAALLTANVIKEAASRDRPDVDALVSRPHTSSFPSSHAATSFACATVLASFEPRLRVPLYVLATLIALSRAYVGVHFPLDVLAGAAWGLLVGWACVRTRFRLTQGFVRNRVL
jgi:membrane-associated phospholipid phosphatase